LEDDRSSTGTGLERDEASATEQKGNTHHVTTYNAGVAKSSTYVPPPVLSGNWQRKAGQENEGPTRVCRWWYFNTLRYFNMAGCCYTRVGTRVVGTLVPSSCCKVYILVVASSYCTVRATRGEVIAVSHYIARSLSLHFHFHFHVHVHFHFHFHLHPLLLLFLLLLPVLCLLLLRPLPTSSRPFVALGGYPPSSANLPPQEAT
jgi:hypothetical protein